MTLLPATPLYPSTWLYPPFCAGFPLLPSEGRGKKAEISALSSHQLALRSLKALQGE